MKVYKIKDRRTGLYSDAGGYFNSRGKTWNNLGALKNSLIQQGYYKQRYGADKALPHEDIVIIEVEIVETEANSSPLNDLIERERRMVELEKDHGEVFTTLVRRIEDQNQNEQFQWVLMTNTKWDHSANCDVAGKAEITGHLKSLKLKQNKDFKLASSYNGGCAVAFATKMNAMTVRLMMTNPVRGINIVKFVETTLDNDEDDKL